MTNAIEKARAIASECALEMWRAGNPSDRVNLTRRARRMSGSEFARHHDHLPLDGDYDYLSEQLDIEFGTGYDWDEKHDFAFRDAYLDRLYEQAIDADVSDDARAAGVGGGRMTPDERKQFVVDWIARHDATQAEVADLVGVGTRAVRSWVDFSEHGRTPSEAVVRLLKVHGGDQ